jgi:OOP family OmpA-OmpF porin
MKKSLLFITLFALAQGLHAQINDPGQVARDGATDHANNDVSNSVDNGLNKTEGAIKGLFKKKKKADPAPASTASATTSAQTANGQTNGASTGSGAAATGPVSLKTYSNYDFVPGEKIIFEDNFADDQDGEFPAHWILNKGQGVVNKVNGADQAFFLTEGNYVRVAPA